MGSPSMEIEIGKGEEEDVREEEECIPSWLEPLEVDDDEVEMEM